MHCLLGGGHGLYIKDVETKAEVADAEVKALSNMRARDVEATLSNKEVKRRIRNEIAVAVIALVALAAAVILFILF